MDTFAPRQAAGEKHTPSNKIEICFQFMGMDAVAEK